MSSQPRGRGRGRGRARNFNSQEPVRRPGETVQQVPQEPVGRPGETVNQVPQEPVRRPGETVNQVPQEPVRRPGETVNQVPQEPVRRPGETVNQPQNERPSASVAFGRGRARTRESADNVRRPGEVEQVQTQFKGLDISQDSTPHAQEEQSPMYQRSQNKPEQARNENVGWARGQGPPNAWSQDRNQQTRYQEQGARPKEYNTTPKNGQQRDGGRHSDSARAPKHDSNQYQEFGQRCSNQYQGQGQRGPYHHQEQGQRGPYHHQEQGRRGPNQYQGHGQRDPNKYKGQGQRDQNQYQGQGQGQRGRNQYHGQDQSSNNHRHHGGNQIQGQGQVVPAGQGRSGGHQNVPVLVNAFCVQSTVAEWVWFQYHVDFNPAVDDKRARSQMINDHGDLLGETRAFDGMKLIIPRKLHNNVTEVYSSRRTDSEQIRLTITFVKELSASSTECINLYNIILRKAQRMMGNEQIGRNYFDNSLAVPREAERMTIIPGFEASIQEFDGGNLLVIDMAHKLLQMDDILKQMYEFWEVAKVETNPDQIGEFRDKCFCEFVGKIVLTKYNNKTYHIDDISWGEQATDTFEMANGQSTSFIEYYRTHYGIENLDPEQPLLVVHPKKKDIRAGRTKVIKLLPQLCLVTGMSKKMSEDPRQKANIQNLTRVGPTERVRTLTDFVRKFEQNANVKKEWSGWNLQIEDRPMEVQGKLLDSEIIYQRDVQLSFRQNNPDWTRDMRSNQLTTCVSLNNWVIIFVQRNEVTVNDFIHTLITVSSTMGINISPPNRVPLGSDRNSNYVQALRGKITQEVQMVVCVLPFYKEDTYNIIKKFCCVDCPVPSQVIVNRTISKKEQLSSVCTKISIQLNCKLGGELWTAAMPNLNSGMMVVGIDVFHDKRKDNSVAGIVCSMNKECTRYYSNTTLQLKGQELIDEIYMHFTEALKKYNEENHTLPGYIVVYRDGVGDGQLDAVKNFEVKQILDCVKDLYPEDYPPRVAVIIVKKRILQRMYSGVGSGNYSNPCPGTVVDTGITKADWNDFFLVSQSVRQGTVSPTHYHIIHNDMTTWGIDRFQRLTYKLCHLYYNWPGTIRVPAPCQYAHKIAYLVGMNIKRKPHPDLADRLFFL